MKKIVLVEKIFEPVYAEKYYDEHYVSPIMQDVRSAREWNYHFEEGEFVWLDTSIMTLSEKKEYKCFIGKKGIVKKCWSDMSCIHGNGYNIIVDFDGIIIGDWKNPYWFNDLTPLIDIKFFVKYLI